MIALGVCLALAAVQEDRAPGHWPQWRGPNRDAVSTETGLLKEWPAGGPTLLWKAEGMGDGVSCPSVAGGMIFILGSDLANEHVRALDGGGRTLWTTPLGRASGEFPGMRFVTMRVPSVDENRLFVVSWEGVLRCLDASTGKVVWQKDYVADLGSRRPFWGFGDFPLVDGPLVVCNTGGPRNHLTAFNKKTGAVVWRCDELKEQYFHAAVVPAEIGGIRQYVVLGYEAVWGVAAKTGKLAWRAERKGQTAVVPAPIVHDGIVLVSSGFGVGDHAFRIEGDAAGFRAAPLWNARELVVHHGGLVRVGAHVYALTERGLACVELATGKVAWKDRCVGRGSVFAADGLLICRSERGPVALVEASPDAYREKGRFDLPPAQRDILQALPIVVGGRLYLRDQGVLSCYDLRGPEYREPTPVWTLPFPAPAKPAPPAGPPPAPVPAAFVPTPNDVVDKLLELAKVTNADVVYDLGSGDGRILLAAAKQYGARAVGYEISPPLVEQTRLKVKEAGLAGQVSVEEKDLFGADLAPATVVTLYLGEPNNARLFPKLKTLKAGTRIVSHQHLLGPGAPPPDRSLTVTSKETGSDHVLHLWTLPFKP